MNERGERSDRGFYLGERYRLVGTLAEGGMSVLSAARDERTGREVAIKLMRTQGAMNDQRRERFEHEIKTTGSLRHPHIVSVLDSGIDERGEPYLVMELLRGRSLEEELRERGTLSLEQALRWITPLMGALAHAHDHGVVHRDIKPSNIFLSRTEDGIGVPKLLDFGIAVASGESRFTDSGVVVGTVQYMSPEQASDARVGPSTDVWSLGAVLFRCLTGRVPFEADAAAGLLLKIVRTPAPSLTSCAPAVGRSFGLAVDRALQKDLHARYPDMRAFAKALCLSARMAGIDLPENPDPIGLPEWPQWSAERVSEECLTQELTALRSVPDDDGTSSGEAAAVESELVSYASGVRTLFVGRDSEREQLDESLGQTENGSGRVVAIVAEAGVGKSRLLSEWRRGLPSSRYRYLEGRCVPEGDAIIYSPIREILRLYFEIKEDDAESRIRERLIRELRGIEEELLQGLGPLEELFSLSRQDTAFRALPPQQKRERILQTVTALLLRIARDRPLVIAIEDVHWIDNSSEQFLAHFVGSIREQPVLVILLYRPEYRPTWIAPDCFRQIELGPLTLDATGRLITSVLGEPLVDSRLTAFVYGRSFGNPLFVEELTRTLLENGTIVRRQGRLALQADARTTAFPETVQGIISERIGRLEESIKRTVQMAAVIGPDFPSDILKNISGLQNEIRSHLAKLSGLELIHENPSSSDADFTFKHALTREVAYQSLVADERRGFHGQIADELESSHPERLEDFCETLASHFANAENWPKALQYARQAGDKAARSYSNNEAAFFYQRAIEALARLPRTPEAIREEALLRFALDGSLTGLGYPEGSRQNLERWVALAEAIREPCALALAYGRMGIYCSQLGETAEAGAYAERAYEQIARTDDIESVVSATLVLCEAYSLTGDYARIPRIAPRTVTQLEEAGRQTDHFGFPFCAYAQICARLMLGLSATGKFATALRYGEKALASARAVGDDPVTKGIVHLSLGVFWAAKGNAVRACEHLLTGIELVEKAGWTWLTADAYAVLSRAHAFLDDLPRARQCAREALARREKVSAVILPGMPDLAMGTLLYTDGDFASSCSHLLRGRETAIAKGDRYMEALSRICLGRSMGAQSLERFEEARIEISRGVELLQELEVRPYLALGTLFLGELYLRRGDEDTAREYITRAERDYTAIEEEYWIEHARALLEKIGRKTG